MPQWFRYVRHADVPAFQQRGWVVCGDLGPVHGHWSTLCMYVETWRPIRAYEDLYEVSSHGVIRSLDRRVANPYPRTIPGRVMSPGRIKDGYLAITLAARDGVKRSHHVSHLVAHAFIGDRPLGHQVCHNDGDRTNNAAFNLRYDTPKNNDADKIKHGTLLVGEHCPASKLSYADVAEIRASRGIITQQQLAEKFGITQSNVSMIQSGTTWASTGQGEPA